MPVCGLNDGVGKSDLSGVRKDRAVDENDFDDVVLVLRARCSSPSRPGRGISAISFSERLKFTHIGESTATVVSWLLAELR